MKILKNYLWLIITLAALVLFVALPLPQATLILRIGYEEPGEGATVLYYATDYSPALSDEQKVTGVISPEEQCITFRLDGSTVKHLTALRLDFPHAEQLIVLKDVRASSRGTIHKTWLACDFFAESRCNDLHNVHIDRVPAQDEAVFSTTADDPYLFLSDATIGELQKCVSSGRGIRLFVALLVLAGVLIAKRHDRM